MPRNHSKSLWSSPEPRAKEREPCWMWRTILVLQAAMAARQIVFVRHGLSKMNVALGRQPWGSPGFIDPDIRDAPLEPSGLAGARALREPLARDAADVELVVSSPLTRALATADALADDACAHFRRGHADAATGLEETEHALRGQASEVSVALLSQENDAAHC